MSTHVFLHPGPSPSAFEIAAAEMARGYVRQRRATIREMAGLYQRSCPATGLLHVLDSAPPGEWLSFRSMENPAITRAIIRKLKKELRLARATRGEWWRAREIINRQMMLLAAIGAEMATLKAQTKLEEVKP